MFVIFVNCIFIAMDDGPAEGSVKYQTLQLAEHVFTGFFAAEMVVKNIAFGFYWNGKGSYLRDSWNGLDFLVVMLGFLGYIPNMKNLTVIRAFRLLRPLRTVRNITGVRVIITAILGTAAALAESRRAPM